METIKLTSKEVLKLIAYKEKIQLKVYGYSIGITAFFLIVSFIPAGFLPSRRGRNSGGDSSLFDMMGGAGFMIMIICLFGILLIYFMSTYKMWSLDKDIKEKKKNIVKLKVRDLRSDSSFGSTEISLYIYPVYKGKGKLEFIDYENFPQLSKGQEVELHLTTNAHYPLSINTHRDTSLEDFQKMIELLQKTKKNEGDV